MSLGKVEVCTCISFWTTLTVKIGAKVLQKGLILHLQVSLHLHMHIQKQLQVPVQMITGLIALIKGDTHRMLVQTCCRRSWKPLGAAKGTSDHGLIALSMSRGRWCQAIIYIYLALCKG